MKWPSDISDIDFREQMLDSIAIPEHTCPQFPTTMHYGERIQIARILVFEQYYVFDVHELINSQPFCFD